MTRGRQPTTGRFSTREELVDFVLAQYHNTQASQSDVARAARVSQGVVAKILTERK